MKKNNEKESRRLRSLIIFALIVSVAGISVVFATLSQTLKITTKGRIQNADWSIKWVAANGNLVVGSGKASKGYSVPSSLGFAPTIDLTIAGIKLEKPGDKVEWIVKAENIGRIDAELLSVNNILDVQLDINQAEQSDIKEEDIIVTITKNDSPLYSAIAIGDLLNSGATQEYVLTLEYADVNYIPSHNVNITITVHLPWTQV